MGQLGDISPEGSVAIGIIVGLLSTSIQSLGLTLQRKSHLLEDDKDVSEPRRPPYKRRRWQLGMLMFVVSNLVGSTIQITTLPLPVLSTLQASGLVFNTAFATLLLKEPFTRYSFMGTILTCAGAALIATFGAVGEPAHSLGQLLELLRRKPFVIWMVMTLVVAGATVIFAHVLKVYSSHQHISRHLHKHDRPRSASKPDVQPLKHSFTNQLPRPLQLRVGRLRFARGLSYALISGILSAHSLLVAKSAVELLVRTIVDHNNQFNQFQSWLILLALLFFALTQLYYLHLGLRLCSTSVLYPFVFCVYNIIAILDGLIYFHQTSRLNAVRGGLIALGTVILLVGVLALSWRLDDATPADSTTPAAMPQTPLTPGMGLVRTSEDSDRSPLLPTVSSHSDILPSANERTPLIGRRTRASTLGANLHGSGSATRDIWAEFGDEEDDRDFLASLPRSPSLSFSHDTLSIAKKRRRGGSTSSGQHAKDRRSSSSSDKNKLRFPRRSQTLQVGGRTDGSIPAVKVFGDDSSEDSMQQSQRKSSGTARSSPSRVRFEERDDRIRSPRPSRWDAGVSPSRSSRTSSNASRQRDPPG